MLQAYYAENLQEVKHLTGSIHLHFNNLVLVMNITVIRLTALRVANQIIVICLAALRVPNQMTYQLVNHQVYLCDCLGVI